MFAPANLKRLFMIFIIMAVVAVMTGTPGSSTASPTTGVHGSFLERVSWFGLFVVPRWLLFMTLGVIVWLVVSFFRPRARSIRRRVDTVLALPKALTAKKPTRITLMLVALVIVLFLPKFVHES